MATIPKFFNNLILKKKKLHKHHTIYSLIFKLWMYLPRKRRTHLLSLLIVMFLSAISEVITIGMVLPFIGVLINPDIIFDHQLVQPIIGYFKIIGSEQLVDFIVYFFIVIVIISGIIRLLFLYLMTKLSVVIGVEISVDIYRKTLYQPFLVHMNRNSSEVINSLIKKTDMIISQVLMPSISIVNSLILLIGIVAILMIINLAVTIYALGIFGLTYLSISYLVRRRLVRNSNDISYGLNRMIKLLQESLGSIRNIIINNSQKIHCEDYLKVVSSFRKAQGSNQIIILSPRYIIESLGVVLIVLVAYFLMKQGKEIIDFMPEVGAFVMGVQRLLPIIQHGYAAFAKVNGSYTSLIDVIDLMDQPDIGHTKISSSGNFSFNKEMKIHEVSFSYSKDLPLVLDNISMTIRKGESIGIIGETGSGKSTLIDIILGLLEVTKGSILMDNKRLSNKNRKIWYPHVTHVPQDIYLSDTTIVENIIFSAHKGKIDSKRLELVSKQSEISNFVESMPDKYKTIVGEGGAKLSGGQRQRIGIARALYKEADIIIFDEATSALDEKTEGKIMREISRLKSSKAIIIVTHRPSILYYCDVVYEVSDRKINKVEV